jgi:hypothetical protein
MLKNGLLIAIGFFIGLLAVCYLFVTVPRDNIPGYTFKIEKITYQIRVKEISK